MDLFSSANGSFSQDILMEVSLGLRRIPPKVPFVNLEASHICRKISEELCKFSEYRMPLLDPCPKQDSVVVKNHLKSVG